MRGHQVFLHLLTGKGALFKNTPEVGNSMKDVLRAERDVVEVSSLHLIQSVVLLVWYRFEFGHGLMKCE